MSRTPSWFDLYDELRSKIRSGEWRAEGVVDRPTVAPGYSPEDFDLAVARLKDEGLLRDCANGTLSVARVRARSIRGASFSADYSTQGRSPTVKTLDLKLLPVEEAPGFVRASLDGSGCSVLVRHHNVQSVDGVPHAVCDSYVPYELIGKRWKDVQGGKYELFAVLKDLGFAVTEKQESLYYDAPTSHERELLGIVTMPAVAVVRLDCVVWSKSDVVEVCQLCDRADLYEFTYRVRVDGPAQ